MSKSTRMVIAFMAIGAATAANGQASDPDSGAPPLDPRSLVAVRAPSPITIDGVLDEAAWATASVADRFVQRRPSSGEFASERTEARVLYDDAAIYVALRMYDTAADSIVGRLARRDRVVHGDWIFVAFDGHRDGRTAFAFGVNPRGVKVDLLIYDDVREDPSWDAVWDVATRVDADGWTAEFRIPFSQLRFGGTSVAGESAWGINFWRRIARRGEVSYWSHTPPDAAGKVSRFGELRGISGVSPPRRVEIMPYSTGRFTRSPGIPADPYHRPNALFGSVGADLRVGLGSAFTVAATVNPDFGQVEADPSRVNLTAYETFYEDRRPFFNEGSDLFQFGWPQLFYSRRIGRAPQGRVPASADFADVPHATTIVAATKVTGRTAAGWSIGAMNAVTAEERASYRDTDGPARSVAVEPLTHYAVSRIGRDFRNGGTSVSALATTTHRRLDESLLFLRSAAYSGGIRLRHRFGGDNHEVSGGLLGSRIEGDTAAIARVQRSAGHYFQRPDAAHLEYDPAKTTLGGYSAQLELGRIGGSAWRWRLNSILISPAFEVNDLGFNPRNDMVFQSAMLGFNRFRPGRWFRRWSVDALQATEHTFGGERVASIGQAFGTFELHNHATGSVWYVYSAPSLTTDALRGGPALARPARQAAGIDLGSDARRDVTTGVNAYATVEAESGGRSAALAPRLSVRRAGRAQVTLQPRVARDVDGWQYVSRANLDGDYRYIVGRLEQTTAALAARLDYTVSPTLSFELHAQPFVSAGSYSRFMEVEDPRAPRFGDRFRELGPDGVERDATASRIAVDLSGDGELDAGFADPDFKVRQFRSNAVLRWEYRPGSTLFLAWSQDRSGFDREARFRPGHDLRRLTDEPATHVLMLKVSHWLGL